MNYKVHWIIDGIVDIEAESKEDAEKKIQEKLQDFVKGSDKLMNEFIAKSIQGSAYLPGSEEVNQLSKTESNKNNNDDKDIN
tara:strand:- start:4232 stop:4477 length:246 start_codon:yes stop_codon:yes gene_type:complete